ncbi:hypothetical protein SAMN04488057_10545 [Cyclobacterium lianum]|uniref:Uncharacterized protein n=1 Tax=Cyclobacterium lianum TaxID=388280 RepID=A0A1M7N3V5_9BACT|nr:hypothetical protein [Cyclobacterium lianum]SHM98240.1 hypothetical protein SAMN04488057_10545 [Cyclobacterium lianum]
MKKHSLIAYILVFAGIISSCEPRIDFDEGQWGDTAFITNVNVFTLQAADHELQEFYESGELTPARRRLIISVGNAVIEEENFTATVTVPASADLTRAGIIINHQSMRVEPVGDTPAAGIITDLSEANFLYKLISADGTTHDWLIRIVQEEQ